jgi:hypothetical protein
MILGNMMRTLLHMIFDIIISIFNFIISLLVLNFNLFPALVLMNENSSDDDDHPKNSRGSDGLPEYESSESGSSESDDSEGPKKREVVEQENHNAPEQIMDDLDLVDKARLGDKKALDEIKRNYSEFFEGYSDQQALNDIGEYLEEEFEPELKRSEEEADAMEREELARNSGSKRSRDEVEAENEANVEDEANTDTETETERERPKRQKRNNDDDDNGNNSGGFSSFGSNEPSVDDQNSSSGGDNFFSKIFYFLLSFLAYVAEAIVEVLQKMY